jgi:hypothetical protein
MTTSGLPRTVAVVDSLDTGHCKQTGLAAHPGASYDLWT